MMQLVAHAGDPGRRRLAHLPEAGELHRQFPDRRHLPGRRGRHRFRPVSGRPQPAAAGDFFVPDDMPPPKGVSLKASEAIAVSRRVASQSGLRTPTEPRSEHRPMPTLLLSHPACLDHLTPMGHPERPDRLRAIERALEAEKFQTLAREQAPLAPLEMIALCHPMDYVEAIRNASPEEGMVQLDGDTSMSPGSYEAALRAVGGGMQAVDEVMTGKAANAFVAVRPPGHHAETARPMGFCLFNNAAIAARYAQKQHGAERAAIVDFDVHHGNGSQDIFWSDKSVMYCSTHEMPLYPGTGAVGERGEFNTIVNAPLRPATAATPSARRSRPRSCRACANSSRISSSSRPASTPIPAIRSPISIWWRPTMPGSPRS